MLFTTFPQTFSTAPGNFLPAAVDATFGLIETSRESLFYDQRNKRQAIDDGQYEEYLSCKDCDCDAHPDRRPKVGVLGSRGE